MEFLSFDSPLGSMSVSRGISPQSSVSLGSKVEDALRDVETLKTDSEDLKSRLSVVEDSLAAGGSVGASIGCCISSLLFSIQSVLSLLAA